MSLWKLKRHAATALSAALILLGSVGPSAQQPSGIAGPPAGDVVLQPTRHPRVPAAAADLWMVPMSASPSHSAALTEFAAAVKMEVDGNFAKALPIFSKPLLTDSPLREYVLYYKGLAQLRTSRPADAIQTFRALAASKPLGYLNEATLLSEAEANEALGDFAAAVAIYERLGTGKPTAPDDVLFRLGRAAQAASDNVKAFSAYSRLYFEFPFSDFVGGASAELDRWVNREPISAGGTRYKLELGRAERLFGAKRYTPAHAAFEALKSTAQGDDRELVELRIAESDYYLKRYRNARDDLRPYIDKASRQGEAMFFYALSLRELNDRPGYSTMMRRVAEEFPTQAWAEEALNNLATEYIVQDDDAGADRTFREMYAKFPSGRYADRAAWKAGWLAYRNGQYADTIKFFESASATFPRSDYRPSWIYWAGRAHEALNEMDAARARYALTVTDYLNSYYGRLAAARLNGATVPPADAPEEPVAGLPPNEPLIRALLDLSLYDQAIDELHYAEKNWGNSPGIEATLAWIYMKQAQGETGERQFTLMRASMNAMKRAYPQYLAAGGEKLPKDLQKIIFPIGYWDLLRKYAAERNLDPYLLAALVCQESTFVASIQSYAKAVGLMQLEAPTARQYAKKLGLRYTASLRTNPEANIKMGTAYLADKIREFGDLHLVLASYNAGERAVHRWTTERPNVPRDEFIDDIPYPQTQLYVKKILGTAEDYRRLYGNDAAATTASR